jgi:putative SOS response-associated peptidase YedK
MCGRYALWGINLLGQRFLIIDPMLGYRSHFNIAPTTENPVIVAGDDGNHIRMMQWGLLPHWTNDSANASKPINARAESLLEKPAFRDLLQHNRCIVPANGFYEWRKSHGRKEPYFIHIRDKTLFGFAGLYDDWWNPDDRVAFSYIIVTTGPNDVVRPLHNRMPVILRTEDEQRWISNAPLDKTDLTAILTPYPVEETFAYPVTSNVNSVLSDGEELIRPIATLDLNYDK